MTVTLPSPARMVLSLVLIAAVFVGALAIGRSHRPRPPSGVPAQVELSSASTPVPVITVPAAPPPLPALKVARPTLSTLRTVRPGGVL